MENIDLFPYWKIKIKQALSTQQKCFTWIIGKLVFSQNPKGNPILLDFSL